MKKLGWLFLVCFTAALTMGGCELRAVEDVVPHPLLPEVPTNLAAAIPSPTHNPLTPEGIALGRMLFYDPGLSVNGQVSCASCHQQAKAFSDGQALSALGVSGKPLLRHTPSLANLAWMEGMFWDGGAKNLEAVSIGPLTHADEMGQDLSALLLYLREHRQYPLQFKKAFGTDSITSPLVLRALAQFQRTLISANSRYDRYVRKEPGGNLSSLELQGMALFRQHCASCHATDFFTDNRFHNNGLNSEFPEDDEQLAYGRGRITGIAQDIGRYKTPTLHNIALTAPYMHDGRFGTLQEVLTHYSSGIKQSATLAPQLQQNGTTGIALTLQEQERLIAFLHTLTDSTFISNEAYGTPWKQR